MILAATVVVIPMVAPYNQLLLLPAVILVVKHGKRLWNENRLTRSASALAMAVVGWPWVAALALVIVSAFLPRQTVQQAWAVPLFTSLGIPIVVLGMLALVLRWPEAASQS